MSQASLLEASDIAVTYESRWGVARVLNGVSFGIREGETLGLVGESGSGKSVLVRALLNLIDPPGSIDSGHSVFEGKDLLAMSSRQLREIRGSRIGTIFPNPHVYLNPLATVGSQISKVIMEHRRVRKSAAFSEAVDLLNKVGIQDAHQRANAYPYELSGGMAQRVLIAMALCNSPRLIIADEPTGGLDVTIQLQILNLMHALVKDSGSSMLLITRDLGIVTHYCDRVAVLYGGQVIEIAPVSQLFSDARHPYTLELLRSGSPLRVGTPRVGVGEPIFNPVAPPPGCPFHPRCLLAVDNCRVVVPLVDEVADNHIVRCHLARRDLGGTAS